MPVIIDPSAFSELIQECERKLVPVIVSRRAAGRGRSQTFGQIRTRGVPRYNYSAACRDRPYLYKLLLDFAEKHITCEWNAITVNVNYECKRHLDRGNGGPSTIVGFGDYSGGDLIIENAGVATAWDIKHTPVTMDFNKHWHWVAPFDGNRYSLVFHICQHSDPIPTASVRKVDGRWLFNRDGVALPPQR